MQVTRRRRTTTRRLGLRGRRTTVVLVASAAVVLAGAGAAVADTTVFGHQQVGKTYKNGLQVSADQTIKPLGKRLSTPYGKFMGSSVSPDGHYLAASSTDKSVVLQVFDLDSYRLIYTVGSASFVNQKLTDPTVGQEGPIYSPDGKYLWLSQQDELTRFPVNSDGTLGAPTAVPLAQVDDHSALPGKPVYSSDGSTLYVPLNGQNTVVALDATTGQIKKTWKVGIAPREIILAGHKLYVSDEGGRTAKSGESTINSYGSKVPANTYLGTSTTGTLSVIDTSQPSAAVASIPVQQHPTAMYHRGNALFVANTNSDTVSIVDTVKNKVVQTVDTRPWARSSVGYEPTGITLTQDKHLLVTLGRANAVAVFTYAGSPQQPVSYLGLLPTDYFPAAVAMSGKNIVVTNTRGVDARGPQLTIAKGAGTAPATGYNTHGTTASLTRFTLPSDRQIASYTAQVYAQNGWTARDAARETGKKAAPVPVPKLLGDPSTIKHVFLLVKENRSYDQVYGDIARGNGDPNLAQFGQKVTPNQHAMAKQFGLYDNLYDIGTNSAEGHNWLMQGDDPEYTESSAGEYIRSYDTEDDVLGHQRSGFLWTAAESAGKTARDYGEFTQFLTKPADATWQKYYCVAKDVDTGGDPSQLSDPSVKSDTESPIPSLNKIDDHLYPKFDTDIPDLYRYDVWKQDFEKNGPANLNMFWLSSDHTGGTPDPEAQVADGDLATGKIVDEISHSKYWKDSAIFVVEDDSQDGVDHVDGHRAPVQIISPWSLHNKVDSTYYTQITLVRTIEQILGAAPLNQKLAAATPMSGAFTNKPNYAPFNAVPNQVPLTEGVATPPDCGLDTLGQKGVAAQRVDSKAAAQAAVPSAQQHVAALWQQWRSKQRFTGDAAVPDYADPEQMNRYTWYQAHQWTKPYPGDPKIYA
ncbi:phosphoesterase, partial [uncultured Jatrophihabitans sp.]|uniref:phosphoesterase n=1 Tax=uncultured Jatrophihabitans sp. TaxID=1610747 RepID=UPI0035C995FC